MAELRLFALVVSFLLIFSSVVSAEENVVSGESVGEGVFDAGDRAMDSDVGSIFVPFFTGAGRVIKLADKGGDAVKVAKAINEGDKVTDKVSDAEKVVKKNEDLLEAFKRNPDFVKKSNQLKREGMVTVSTFDEANALLKNTFPDAKKFTGTGPYSKPEYEKAFSDFKKGDAYHTDYIKDPSTGRIFQHGIDNPHAYSPHINIRSGREKYNIIIDDMVRLRK